MARSKKREDYTFAVGRRKSASARARVHRGRKKSLINEIPIEEYFPNQVMQTIWEKPFKITDTLGKYYATVKVKGGGKKGQLEASVHGVSRALAKLDKESYRLPLKKAGLLTRDARVKERRKVGTGGKARRKKQSPKR